VRQNLLRSYSPHLHRDLSLEALWQSQVSSPSLL
jgi:hypothetical protein